MPGQIDGLLAVGNLKVETKHEEVIARLVLHVVVASDVALDGGPVCHGCGETPSCVVDKGGVVSVWPQPFPRHAEHLPVLLHRPQFSPLPFCPPQPGQRPLPPQVGQGLLELDPGRIVLSFRVVSGGSQGPYHTTSRYTSGLWMDCLCSDSIALDGNQDGEAEGL